MIVAELENRQKALQTQDSSAEDSKQDDIVQRLTIQELVKISRALMHLGCSHEVNQSNIILRTLSNILHKSKEKMTTNQTTEALFLIRQVMLYPVAQFLHPRLLNIHNQLREQIEAKIFKIDVKRLLFFLLQDRYLKDSNKVINASKEFKGNLIKAALLQIPELHSKEELHLFSNLFFNHIEDGKLIALTLQQINKHVHQVKEIIVQKRAVRERESLNDHLFSINKLIYLICTHECQSGLANQSGPGFIGERDHWTEIETHLNSLKVIKAYDSYEIDSFTSEVQSFQKVILDDKKLITGYVGDEIQKAQRTQGFSKVEKAKELLKEKSIIFEQEPFMMISNEKLSFDIILPEQKTVLQLIDHVKIPHEIRFIKTHSILEANKLLLLGDEQYSISRQIIQGFENMQLSPINAYFLKYFKGYSLKLIDHKRLKDEVYFRSLIQ